MLLTIRMIKLANLVVNRGVSIAEISTIFIAVIPTFLEIALPLAALLGVMLAFARLSGDSEIIVLRGSGISISGMVGPIVIFGILVTILGQLTSVYLRPWGFRTLQDGLYQIAKSRSTAGLEQAVFNKLGAITLYAQTIDHSTGDLNHVVVDDKRQGQSRRVIIAQRGYVTSQDQQRTLSLLLIDGTIHEQIENKYILTRFEENNILLDPQALYGEEGDKRGRKVAELSNQEIGLMNKDLQQLPAPDVTDIGAISAWRLRVQEIMHSDDAKMLLPKDIALRLARNQIEYGRRFSLPCASLFLALLGMALGIQPARAQRAWGASLSIALGMGVFIVYYVLFSVSVTLAETQKISPLVALWGPNLLVGLLSLYLIKKISSEQWSSVSAGLEAIINPLLRALNRHRGPKINS